MEKIVCISNIMFFFINERNVCLAPLGTTTIRENHCIIIISNKIIFIYHIYYSFKIYTKNYVYYLAHFFKYY
jgi:hypothetical protein